MLILEKISMRSNRVSYDEAWQNSQTIEADIPDRAKATATFL